MKNKSKVHDLTGQKFGMLTVVGIADTETRKTYWVCRCDCGNMKTVRSDGLLCGAIKSCGCLKKKQDRINLTKHHSHKMSGTRIYSEWQQIKCRCYNKGCARYADWGGRGIKVCDQWKNDFEAFYKWAMENGYKDNLTIDRIDNDGDYCPQNCRWVDQKTQCRNRRSNVNITIGNSTRTMTEWCEIFQIDYENAIAKYHRNNDITIDELFNG